MERLVRARTRQDPESGPLIAVYQAYQPAIADWALEHGTFGGPNFGLSRMTWIKPSFFWMAYRCGWCAKPNQERALRIWLRREAFEGFLAQSALSMFDPELHACEAAWKASRNGSCVQVQWDPERSVHIGPTKAVRAIQIGLSGPAVETYVGGAIAALEDVTETMLRLGAADRETREAEGAAIKAEERPIRLPPEIARRIGADQPG